MKTKAIGALAAVGGAVAALGAMASIHAFAQPAPPPAPPYGAGAQGQPPQGYGGAGWANSGGGPAGGAGVTLSQFQAHMRNRLMKADTDHDGRISLSEWTAWRAAHPGHGGGAGQDPSRSFARMDRNGDGYVTPDEIDATAARRFARMDLNHDGVLTPEERAQAHAARGGGGGDGSGDGGVQPLGPQ